MQGMKNAGMCATGKHYPGHGQVAPDSHKELPVDARSYEQLTEDLQPFTQLIAMGLPSVMMAHILYPAIDDLPASLSHHWVTERLRKDCGFKGAVFTDDLSMGGAAAMGSYTDRASLALQAGCDMLPVCNFRDGVVELLDNLKQAQPDAAEARLSRLRGSPMTNIPARSQQGWKQAQSSLKNLNA